jgi:serine protease inhibitor
LAVSQARQDAIAEFTATGFRAAAVTAVAIAPGAAPPRMQFSARRVTVVFDRPFGFFAAHRPTGLVLVAGWVAEPERMADKPWW